MSRTEVGSASGMPKKKQKATRTTKRRRGKDCVQILQISLRIGFENIDVKMEILELKIAKKLNCFKEYIENNRGITRTVSIEAVMQPRFYCAEYYFSSDAEVLFAFLVHAVSYPANLER